MNVSYAPDTLPVTQPTASSTEGNKKALIQTMTITQWLVLCSSSTGFLMEGIPLSSSQFFGISTL